MLYKHIYQLEVFVGCWLQLLAAFLYDAIYFRLEFFLSPSELEIEWVSLVYALI